MAVGLVCAENPADIGVAFRVFFQLFSPGTYVCKYLLALGQHWTLQVAVADSCRSLTALAWPGYVAYVFVSRPGDRHVKHV